MPPTPFDRSQRRTRAWLHDELPAKPNGARTLTARHKPTLALLTTRANQRMVALTQHRQHSEAVELLEHKADLTKIQVK
jgi:hypothetical protein